MKKNLIIIFSPLEQFKINPLIGLIISNSSITTILIICIFILLLYIIDNNYINMNGFNILFIRHISWWFRTLNNNAKYGTIFYTLILTIWFIILLYNLIGLLPYSFTVTSHMVIGFGLSIPSFILMIILGFYYHRIFYLSVLLPSGVPSLLWPLIILIELVSLLARIFSLAIRLVANLLTGHTLIKLVASQFTLPLIILIILEFAVGALQAYVFVLLTISYINDSLILH